MTETNRVSIKDFFLQLGAIASLYASLVAVVILLFRVINEAYPMITNGYYYGKPSISLQVATLIVFFPIFLLLSWLLQRDGKKEFALRKWLSYLTLFIAGLIVAGDLVSVLYTFLDGQELTTAFLLKALVLLIVAGGAFTYFLQDIRNRMGSRDRNLWRIISLAFIIISIVLGFKVMGSPMTQRQEKYDKQKLENLQSIQWQIVTYWQQKNTLPDNLEQLKDPISNWVPPIDPQSNVGYEYQKTGELSFSLCAHFNRENQNGKGGEGSQVMPMYGPDPIGRAGENWAHTAGRYCFLRTIDPELYPTRKLPL